MSNSGTTSYYQKRSSGQLADSQSRRVYLLGKKIGLLTVLEEFTPELKHLHAICKCDCGRTVKKWRAGLISGETKSCGECVDYREDLAGMVLGNFKVLLRGKRAKGVYYWSCECLLCNKVKDIRSDGLKGLTARCRCSPNNSYTGYKDLSGCYWSSIVCRARNHNHDLNLTIEEAYSLLKRQDFKCIYTGRDLTLGTWESGNKDRTVSLDRIDSDFGYSMKNCDWLHKDINIMKWSFSKDFFISMAHLVVNPMTSPNNKEKNKITKTLFCIWDAGWRRKAMEYNLDIDFLQTLLEKQDYKCCMTGIPLNLAKKTKFASVETTASIDRIDSNKGYVKDNVQFMHKYINCMKLDFTDDEFKSICKEISDYCCVQSD